MDCRDRFGFWLAELLLEPVRALGAGEDDGSVTVRAAHGARRFNMTIARTGGDYRWSFREVAAPGKSEPTAPLHEDNAEPLSNAEDAFWAAWSAIEQRAG
jgi:hypothetical protein